MAKIRISIIEDQDEIRKGIVFLISSAEEFECIGNYSNAEDALSDLEFNKPDVVIMDIGLPGMSGIECTREIKAKYPKIQIMISTVYEDDDRLFSALSAGASSYMLKRTSPGLMLDSIRDLYQGGAPMSPQIGRKVVESLHRSGNQDTIPHRSETASILKKRRSEKEKEYNLSKRELEILELLSAGFRNKEIADKLFISTHTVRTHIYHIYEKLHVQSRVEALNKLSS